jgi:hypothetical protein
MNDTNSANIDLNLNVYDALEIRDILFDHQKGYGTEHVPERIRKVRNLIKELDVRIKTSMNGGCPPGTVYIDGVCADL